MKRVFPAAGTILVELQARGRVLALGYSIVPRQAIGANQKNFFPSHKPLFNFQRQKFTRNAQARQMKSSSGMSKPK